MACMLFLPFPFPFFVGGGEYFWGTPFQGGGGGGGGGEPITCPESVTSVCSRWRWPDDVLCLSRNIVRLPPLT